MSRTSMLIVLGVVNILTPFSGLPVSIRTLIAIICGACIFGIGLSLRTHETHAIASPPNEPPPSTPLPSSVSPI